MPGPRPWSDRGPRAGDTSCTDDTVARKKRLLCACPRARLREQRPACKETCKETRFTESESRTDVPLYRMAMGHGPRRNRPDVQSTGEENQKKLADVKAQGQACRHC